MPSVESAKRIQSLLHSPSEDLLPNAKKERKQRGESTPMEPRRSNNSIRILMFPWLAHGHISPFVQLGKKLAQRSFQIYLCSTPINLGPFKKELTDDYQGKFSGIIELVELPLPTLPDLPPQYHTTKGLPHHLLNTLFQAFDTASPTFYNILTTIKPDLLIFDVFQAWAAAMASSLNIPAVMFLVVGTKAFGNWMSSLKNTGSITGSANDNLSPRARALQSFEASSEVMLVKSFREIEAKYMDALSILGGKKIVPVGPLVEEKSQLREAEDTEVREWLNRKEPSSVVYVSFGSEYYLSKEDREELAHGLLLSQVNFVWVLRFPQGERITAKEALPEGYIDMIADQGLIIEQWAPQTMILGHPSTGGFVCHCGWGSIIESMKFGVPIIAIPMQFDQPMHARLTEEVGVGLVVKRDEKEDKLERNEVARAIRAVVLEETGEKIRKKAKDMRECIREKGDKDIDEAVNDLIRLCGKGTDKLV